MYGQGAGMMPTASAVVADCMEISKNLEKPISYGPEKSQVKKIKNMKEIESRYYMRITALDQPGVLHTISGILSNLNISIESVSQKKLESKLVPIFIVTHLALEKNMQKARTLIDKLSVVKNETILLRLLN
jgi:homoserine dehydrogenase